MNSSSNSYDADSVVEEEKKLETALYDSDRLLQDALRADDRRRCVRRRVLFSLIVGGIVMGTIVVAALAGWLTLFAPPPAASPEAGVDVDAWVEKLSGLRDHMHTAFGVGPDLTLLDPDTGVEIVRKAWPQIHEEQVKTGLLKTFAFSKALPKKHARVLQVLDIGMHDKDPNVRKYAAAYVKEYSGTDFSTDPQGYAKWYQANKDKDPESLLVGEGTGASPEAKSVVAPADRKKSAAQAGKLGRDGWALWNQGEYEQAAGKFEEAVNLDPRAAHSWNGLGWARFNSGDPDAAVSAFEKCVALAPKHAGALNGLGQIYLGQGKYDKAERYLLKSAASPGASAANYGLARLYLLTNKFDKAQIWAKKALDDEPNDLHFKSMLDAAEQREIPNSLRAKLAPAGVGFAMLNIEEESKKIGREAAEGWDHVNRGQLRSAESSFRAALAKKSDNASALIGLGSCLLMSGKPLEAKPYFEKCLGLDSKAAGAMDGLADCLKEEGKFGEAIAMWEKMCKQNPNSSTMVTATAKIAETYSQRKEYDRALPYLEQLVKWETDNEEYKRGLEEAKKALQSKQQ